MSKKAVVQGEVHIFPTDRESLMNRQIRQFQALYCEGRSETISPHRHRNRYNLYVIGVLTLYLIYGVFSYIYSNLLPNSKYDIEVQARQAGLAFDDCIDLEIHEIFDSYSIKTANSILMSLIAIFVFLFLFSFSADTLSFGISGLIMIQTPIPLWVVTLIFAVLLPFTYFSLLVSFANSGDRDKQMARSIMKKCDDRGHDSVLVLVGDKHVEPIAKELDKEGWEVEKHRSNSIIARITQKLELG